LVSQNYNSAEIDQPIRSSQHRKLIAVDSAKSISATATVGVLKGEKPAELRERPVLLIELASAAMCGRRFDPEKDASPEANRQNLSTAKEYVNAQG
jgi:hypothetical protein